MAKARLDFENRNENLIQEAVSKARLDALSDAELQMTKAMTKKSAQEASETVSNAPTSLFVVQQLEKVRKESSEMRTLLTNFESKVSAMDEAILATKFEISTNKTEQERAT